MRAIISIYLLIVSGGLVPTAQNRIGALLSMCALLANGGSALTSDLQRAVARSAIAAVGGKL